MAASFVSRLSDEQLMTLYIQCHEESRDAQRAYLETTAEDRKRQNDLRLKLLSYLTKHKDVVDCIQYGEEAFVRLHNRATLAERIGPELVADVVEHLTPQTFRDVAEEVAQAVRVRYGNWITKEKARVRAEMRRKNHDEVPDVTATLVPPPPPAPNPTRPKRPVPIIKGPLTRRQMLAEVVYATVRDRHKPQVPTLRVQTKPGRSAHVVRAERLGTAVLDAAHDLIECRARVAEASKTRASVQKRCRALLAASKERLMTQLTKNGHRVKRELAMGGTRRTVSLSVDEKATCKARPTLWDVSQSVDAAVATLTRPELDLPYDPSDAAWLLDHSILAPLHSDVVRRMQNVQCPVPKPRLCVRRIRFVEAPDGSVMEREEEEQEDDEQEEEDEEEAGDDDEN